MFKRVTSASNLLRRAFISVADYSIMVKVGDKAATAEGIANEYSTIECDENEEKKKENDEEKEEEKERRRME